MDDEFIDILNEDLTIRETCLKSFAHMHGLLHTSVHIWFYTNNGKLLFQKRAKTKIAFPNLWDISVAGHVTFGESISEAAIREIKEEIGLVISKEDLIEVGTFKEHIIHSPTFIDNEIHYIFLYNLTVGLNQLEIQKEELSELKIISIEEFQYKLSRPNHRFVPHQMNYYNFILSEISKRL